MAADHPPKPKEPEEFPYAIADAIEKEIVSVLKAELGATKYAADASAASVAFTSSIGAGRSLASAAIPGPRIRSWSGGLEVG
jgi:type IV secretory pathway TrbL component